MFPAPSFDKPQVPLYVTFMMILACCHSIMTPDKLQFVLKCSSESGQELSAY